MSLLQEHGCSRKTPLALQTWLCLILSGLSKSTSAADYLVEHKFSHSYDGGCTELCLFFTLHKCSVPPRSHASPEQSSAQVKKLLHEELSTRQVFLAKDKQTNLQRSTVSLLGGRITTSCYICCSWILKILEPTLTFSFTNAIRDLQFSRIIVQNGWYLLLTLLSLISRNHSHSPIFPGISLIMPSIFKHHLKYMPNILYMK